MKYNGCYNVKKFGYRIVNLCGCVKLTGAEINWTKNIYTCCLWFTCLVTGMVDKQLGPALPDIQQRTHVQFAVASWYISVLFFGSIVGSLLAAIIYGKVPPNRCLCLACTGLAISEALLPWCDSAVKAYLANFVIGVCYAHINSFVVAELCGLWGNDVAVPMLINYLSYAMGGILSSAVTAPFLSKMSVNNTEYSLNYKGSSEFYIPFTSSAIITSVAAILHFIIYCKSSSSANAIMYINFDSRSEGINLSSIQRALMLLLTGSSLLMVGAITYNMFYILPYFLIKQARISLSDAAYTVTLFTTFQCVGRVPGFMIVKTIGNYRLLVGYSIVYLASIIGLWNCVTYSTLVSRMFLTAMAGGFGQSALFPCTLSLVEERFFPVTGSIAGFTCASFVTGNLLASTFMGYLADTFTPFVFVYAAISESLLFLLFVLLTKCVSN